MRLIIWTFDEIATRRHSATRIAALVVSLAARDPQHAVPEHLQRMPWFAIVVRFLAKRLGDGDDADHVSELLCNNALLAAMPAGVRARTFGQLIDNLALRIHPPVGVRAVL
jgi:hypothetical protein